MEAMMISTTSRDLCNQSISTFPPWKWKLYDNPFYNHHHHHSPQQQQHQHGEASYNHCRSHSFSGSPIHHLHLPSPSSHRRSISASFLDPTMTMTATSTKTELGEALSEVIELKAELEFERKVRKKMECLIKRQTKELAEQRRGRETAERLCDELARQVLAHKEETERSKREMEEERRMLKVAELLREERVQMKLEEGKLLYEEKLLCSDEGDNIDQSTEMRRGHQLLNNSYSTEHEKWVELNGEITNAVYDNRGDCGDGEEEEGEEDKSNWNESSRVVNDQVNNDNNGVGSGIGIGFVSPISVQRRASPEPENPHIRRGIKGFVEFPRVVKVMNNAAAASCKKRSGLGNNYKLECQKAQLRILLRHNKGGVSTISHSSVL